MPKLKTPTPTHWTKCQLGNFISLRNGYAFASSSYQKQGIPLVRISNLTTTHQVIFDETICVEDKPEYQNFVITKGDLLLAMSGATTGKLAIYDSSIKAFQNQRVGNLKILDENVCYDKFRNYLFFSLSSTILKLAYGGAQPNISGDKLLSLQCFLPPLAEQKRIVKKIEELFAVIDKNIQKLEHTQQALIQYRQSVLNSYLNTHKGNPTTLGEIISPRRERVTYNGDNGNIPFIGLDCIAPNALAPFKVNSLQDTKSTCFMFYKNDVLYGRMRSYLNKVFKAEINGAASAEFIVFPSNTQILPDYLKYTLHQQKFVEFATRNSSGDRPRVKFEEDLSTFSLSLPSFPEQKAIVEKIEKAFTCADNAQAAISAALEQAKQLKQSILKRAFEGRLVPQDPNDKPVDLTQLTPKGKTK